MYSYIICHPDIGYVVITLSKFSSAPTDYHYNLLNGGSKYLHNTIEWGIWIQHTKPLYHVEFQLLKWYNIPIKPINDQIFEVDINQPILTGFVDTAYVNELQKRRSTTELVFFFLWWCNCV